MRAADEAEVRRAIERWVAAVDQGDLAGVLGGRADDVVMFDVPPPEDGVRGASAYARAWPAFLAWQRSEAAFELVDLEVTAGADVAFAWALLRCDTAERLRARPERRLRLTLGLRREDGAWVVAHEHHSFTHQG